jgi:hypothetical protein
MDFKLYIIYLQGSQNKKINFNPFLILKFKIKIVQVKFFNNQMNQNLILYQK